MFFYFPLMFFYVGCLPIYLIRNINGKIKKNYNKLAFHDKFGVFFNLFYWPYYKLFV